MNRLVRSFGHFGILEEMQRINASQFKERCLSLLDHLEPEGLVITKRGKPVAKVIPIRSSSASLIGSMKGKIKIKGDIFSTGIEWEASSRPRNAQS